MARRELERIAAKIKTARDALEDARVIGQCAIHEMDRGKTYSISLLVGAAATHASVLYAHVAAEAQRGEK